MKLELVVAVISGFVAIASALVAYMAQTSAARSQSQIALIQLSAQQAHERQKPFVEAQLKYYIEAAETVARIPRTSDKNQRGKLIDRFWELYWGPLAVVEDQAVAGAMIAYGKQIAADPHADAQLQNLALGVAHACRDSLKALWVQQLGDIKSVRPPAK